ncbi:hypothetical protein FRZ67_13085 [Panacibacter ginsenosidivorans]|uniref:Gliding motility lipoprotein GldB n=1 Tax=Panacibacter ginsenosidivorans TaxID=1813871 RepID=A0A5B8VA95_9BACT|nr:hypothetical protein [Panacibacter ginsenosidivorans]QEC68189.1 hypothetical protein FRZ67_13085 [Panacibacter ginsenosidivorans]
MKRIAFALLVIICAYSCSDKKSIPNVSNIKVQIDVKRFDKDFFALDTNNVETSLNKLQQQYPTFLNDYLYNILGIEPIPDSVTKKVKRFIYDYKSVYESVQSTFTATEKMQKEITKGCQFVKYYFPEYKLPQHIITYIGPIEGYANVLTNEGLAVGLQLYLGKDYSLYQTGFVREVYAEYQSRRFEPAYIPVNCMKNMMDEIYPAANPDQPLIYQMIEAGKRLYMLDQFLPETADSLKTGYTQAQLDGCYESEATIWNFFLQNNLLYITDPSQTRDYVTDGPRTELLGEASPGFIGQFVGWQIVKKWMSEDSKRTLPQLLKTPAKEIFEEAKYKPR